MTARKFLIGALVFLAGWFAASSRSHSVARSVEAPSMSHFKIERCNNPGLDPGEYKAYRVVVDGKASMVSDPPEGNADVYRVESSDGRLVMFTTRN